MYNLLLHCPQLLGSLRFHPTPPSAAAPGYLASCRPATASWHQCTWPDADSNGRICEPVNVRCEPCFVLLISIDYFLICALNLCSRLEYLICLMHNLKFPPSSLTRLFGGNQNCFSQYVGTDCFSFLNNWI